ncbi:hypothetical protein F511_37613 [Dorcoceras hygrometricum]|uniref:Uncharacterized protein n=1 Tax=Dorcoceras hygrometricum TaxID=472368 RepID=A0A2Z7BTF0_9LAMI|nr:hypothetical protein F511_37613 [Dorcoceras hygrometricum]
MTSAESVDGSTMMTSAVMSSQSAVEQKQYQQLIREEQEMERRRFTLNSESDQVTVDKAVEDSETDEVIEQKLLADTITEAVGHTITVSDDSNH